MNEPDRGSRRRLTLKEIAAVLLVAALPAVVLALLIAAVSRADEWILPVAILLPVVFALCLMPAMRIGPALIARYDDGALRVAPAAAVDDPPLRDFSANQKAAWVQLLRWCFDGAGDGRTPLWRPWMAPHVVRPFSMAVLVDPAANGASLTAEAFSREIDGSHQLTQAGGSVARLWLRLRVKWQDCCWWRARELADPWDSGYLIDDPRALQHLRAFHPRRATLMVAVALPPDALLERIAVLSARCEAFQHPVRLLVVDGALPAALGLSVDPDGTTWHNGTDAVPVMDLSGR